MSENRCDECGNLTRFCPCNSVPPEPLDAEWIDDEERPILKSLVGRTITSVEPFTSDDGVDYLGGVKLNLDDGATVNFVGWGYDYWGLRVYGSDPA